MIIKLRKSTRVMVQCPVQLCKTGYKVAVVYASNGTMSGGAMAQ